MANTLGIDYAEDAGEMMTDSGQTCTIASVSVECVAGAETRVLELEDTSDVVMYERPCLIKTADVASVPAMYSKVTMNALVYSVTDLVNDPDEGVIVLQLQRKVDR
jgi:hypothetical protein